MHFVGKIGMVLLASVALAGCTQKQSTTKESSSSKTVAVSHKATTKTAKLAWSATKADRLETFMGEFGVSMEQNYTQVTGKTATMWNDIDLSGYLRANKQVRFDEATRAVNWLPAAKDGAKQKQNVVAVYADDADKILYLFTLQPSGAAQVWVSESGLKNDVLTVTKTENKDLLSGFKQIVAGKTPAKSEQAASSTASSSATSSSAATSSSQAASSSASSNKQTHAVVFDQSYQRTWYGYNTVDDSSTTVTFGPNEARYSGDAGGGPVYQASERTAADNDVLNKGTVPTDQTKMNWGAAATFTDDENNTWINVRGWYQTAGDGTYYRIAMRDLDGKQTPVLETASGAGMWLDANYYPTQALADQYRTQTYDDEHTQDE